ncbi:MAG: RHS repeat-associated core domain-containing protein [Terriglobales bacterium]
MATAAPQLFEVRDCERFDCPDGTNAEGYTYTYDEFGNRWTQSLASGSGPGFEFSYNFDRNNHLTPTSCTDGAGNFCYDGAGNLEYDGMGGNWSHDAEGRVFNYSSSSASATYTSDGAGHRVQRIVNGTTYDYVFDNQGHENTKATGGFAASAWSELYLGGMHVNTYANGSTYFSHSDHLGSERTETDPTGNTNGSYETNLPFGEWTGSGFESEKGFTGDLLDNADGYVFHTPFRQYTQAQGRWMIPDPAGLAAVDSRNPQTWNRYAYALNNPVSLSDPSGLVTPICDDDDDDDDGCDDGGGGDGGDGACDAWCQLQQDEANAALALNNQNSPCATVVDGGTGFGVNVLSGGLDSIGLGGNLPDGTGGVTAQNGGTWSQLNSEGFQQSMGVTSNITMNSNPSGYFMDPNTLSENSPNVGTATGYSTQTFQTIEVLHEIGHAANFYFLNAGIAPPSAMVTDGMGGEAGAVASIQNTNTAANACFPQGDFGSNSGPLDDPTAVNAHSKPMRHRLARRSHRRFR